MADKLYVGTYSSGKILSFNGTTWELATETPEFWVKSLGVYNNSLFAGTWSNANVYVTDNTTAWDTSTSFSGLGRQFVHALTTFENNLYVGVGDNDSSIRRFNGTVWDVATTFTQYPSPSDVHSLYVYNNSLFAGTDDGGHIYISANGSSWIEANDKIDPPSKTITSFASYNNSLFAGGEDDASVYVTNDGLNWNLSSDFSPINNIHDLASFGNNLYAGSSASDIYRFNGTVWDIATTFSESDIYSLNVYNNSLFAGTDDKVYVTENGTTWDLSTTVSGEVRISSMVVYNDTVSPSTPTVTIQAVSNISYTTATGNANITSTGGENPSLRGFAWNISSDPTISNDVSSESGSFGTGTYNLPITGLNSNTSYYVRAFASNSIGLSYSNNTSFTTLTPTSTPTITTQAVTGISYTTATGNGNITATGGENPSLRGFAYDTSSSPTIANSVRSEAGSFGTGAFNLGLTSLTPSTIYYIKAFASNSAGLAYGNETNFTTSVAGETLIYGAQKVAQQFSFPMTASLNRVNLSMSRNVSSAPVTSNIIIEIQENDTVSNIPNGSIVTTSINTFTDSGYKNFYFTDRPLIKGNDKYWIVASAYDADYENAYDWSSTSNADNTRYRAVGNAWSSSTTAAQNMSAFVPHDRFNYQQFQGSQTVVENFSGGDDFYVVDKQTDMERIFNDITVVGRGDGINQVSARSLDTTSINTYGRRQQKIEDKSLTTASDCQCVADTLIGKYKDPVTVFDLDMTDPNLESNVGDKVAIFSDIRDINSESYRVISTEDYADMFEDGIKFNLNNAKTSIITDIDKIKKDKDLQNTYGQGATNLFQLSEEDNCDENNGLKVLFYIPDEAKSINSVKMRWSRKPFRGYTLTTAAGGGSVQTSSAAADASRSKGDGDVNQNSSETTLKFTMDASGVSYILGSTLTYLFKQTLFNLGSSADLSTARFWLYNCDCSPEEYLLCNCPYTCPVTTFDIAHQENFFDSTCLYCSTNPLGCDPRNDKFQVCVVIPASGSPVFGWGELNVIAPHDHTVTIPAHTHDQVYGIFTPGSEDVVQIDLYVNTTGGTPAHTFTGVAVDDSYPADIELSPYITTTGWHYIYLKPTYESGSAGTLSNARLQANAYVQIYIESK